MLDDLGCWMIKSRIPPSGIVLGWAPGEERVLTRCVRSSYRLGIMHPGQPCLLWLSGKERPGVHAVGSLLSEAELPDDDPDAGPVVRVRFRLLHRPIPRQLLLSDQVLSAAEVIRMPAGRNPSYLSRPQLDTLRDLLHPTDTEDLGW
jgi:hypothetical protein